jgi:hypothetical protein
MAGAFRAGAAAEPHGMKETRPMKTMLATVIWTDD